MLYHEKSQRHGIVKKSTPWYVFTFVSDVICCVIVSTINVIVSAQNANKTLGCLKCHPLKLYFIVLYFGLYNYLKPL